MRRNLGEEIFFIVSVLYIGGNAFQAKPIHGVYIRAASRLGYVGHNGHPLRGREGERGEG